MSEQRWTLAEMQQNLPRIEELERELKEAKELIKEVWSESDDWDKRRTQWLERNKQ